VADGYDNGRAVQLERRSAKLSYTAAQPDARRDTRGVLVVGCGYVGGAVSRTLSAAGHPVWTASRRPRAHETAAIRHVIADVTVDSSLDDLPGEIAFVIYAVSPDAFTDVAYERAYVTGVSNVIRTLARKGVSLTRFVLLSSCSVYEQGDGGWVDEQTDVQPMHFSGRRIRESECLLAESGVPSTALRLGYIYGPDRPGILNAAAAAPDSADAEANRYHNFIHVQDCAGIVQFVVNHPSPASLYVAVDREPTLRRDALRWLRSSVDAAPPERDSESAPLRKPLRGNKQCSSARLHSQGYRFAYPTFRDGFAAMRQMATAADPHVG
jgi:nucleoside-diphosphate-sugar epimerase